MDERSKPCLDTFAEFLLAHPLLVVEVTNDRDTRGGDVYSTDITKIRSRSICDYLIAKGVAREQVMYKGYRRTMPLISEAYINSFKSKVVWEQLHQLNRRTELKIISVK